MSLTLNTYIDRVFYRASGGVPESQAGIYRTAIEATMGDAIYEMCVASLGEDWRALLEADFALTLSSGVADFSANTALLPESIPYCNKITHSSVAGPGTVLLPFIIKPSKQAMAIAAADTSSVFGYAYVGKTSVEALFQGANMTGTLNVRAVSIPAIGSVPAQLEGKLIEIGTRLAIAKVMQEAA